MIAQRLRDIRGRVWPYLALALGIVLIAAVVLPVIALGSSRVPQPVDFNHLKHTQDLGLGCEFCHPYAQTSAHSGLPDATTCSVSARRATETSLTPSAHPSARW